MSNFDSLSVPLFLEEQKGRKRVKEPVSVGVPFPKGMVFEPSRLVLMDADGGYHPVQTQPLAFWFDGSAKWVLLDFRADVEANAVTKYLLRSGSEQPSNGNRPTLSVRETSQGVIVDTGKAAFSLNRNLAKPFDRVVVGEVDLISEAGSSFVLIDENGREHIPHIHEFAIEASGPLRANIKVEGEFKAGSSAGGFARFVMRLSFYANSDIVEIRLTLHNPRAARHPGGLWDLGDEGSIYFKDLSIHIPLRSQTVPGVAWTTDTLHPLSNTLPLAPDTLVTDLEIYQDSSGGENWLSTNHVNRWGEVKHSFRGYRVTTEGSQIESGLRATPILSITGEHGFVVATIDRFWQNFPKALDARGNELVLRLFPRQYNDLFELQGGEQKTHTAYLGFSGQGVEPADLAWTHERLAPRAAAEWYAASKACSYLSPLSLDPNLNCQELIDGAISGSQSFFARREIIDEYGWRHFGDLYADHEAVGHTGETPLVAHYNNQYDVLHGAIIEYLRGSDLRWFELASDLARHVIDIDIYHTQEDRAGYNGGLFWHTDHYLDSGTATHRAYSKASLKNKDSHSYGGGPSNEQNYTSGLLHYYYLTGDQSARDSVISLADWVINMDDGSRRFFGFNDRRPTGLASSTASRDYHGPGRGAGNSINALLDAHLLTHQQGYLAKAEQLIRRCIHPDDNIDERNLGDPEHRWSYLVFLQVIGKYLEIKNERNEVDFMYGYAQASLLHYADWMLEYEVPYSTVLDKVEIPTETWPAQDMRKCAVFHLAAKHAPQGLRSALRRKAEFFFNRCINDLRGWKTCTLTRPLVLLLTNAYLHSYFQQNPDDIAPQPEEHYDFGRPEKFSPQFAELYRARENLSAWIPRILNCRRRLLVSFSSPFAKRIEHGAKR